MTSVLYGEDPLQQVKVFTNRPENKKNLVFIHGGAWRDPNNTFDDFKLFAEYLNKNYPQLNVYSINYRLLPKVRHPLHIDDVSKALTFLYNQYDVHEASLAGHSAGATIICQIIDNQAASFGKLPVFESCYLMAGVYSIPELLLEYPDYIDFIGEAFSEDQYSTTTYEFTGKKLPKLVIIESFEDELISLRQAQWFRGYLDGQKVPYSYSAGKWGKHEEMYRRVELFEATCQYFELEEK